LLERIPGKVQKNKCNQEELQRLTEKLEAFKREMDNIEDERQSLTESNTESEKVAIRESSSIGEKEQSLAKRWCSTQNSK
jgi:hypothetical protein